MTEYAELTELLHKVGIGAGSVLVVEGQGDRLEDPGGGFAGLVAALTAAIGPDGTLVVPTCTAAEGYPKPTFDPALAPSEMGPLSEFFRTLPGALRSHSATHSVSALGPAARDVVAGHRAAGGRPSPWGDGPFGVGSPWDVLRERDAWWLIIDGGLATSPFTQYAAAVYAAQHSGVTRETPFPQIAGDALQRALHASGAASTAAWQGHRLAIFRLRPALDAALHLIERRPAELGLDDGFTAWQGRLAGIAQNGYLKAGAARVAITPPIPCRRWEGKLLTGVYRDLYARAVVLEHGSERIAFVLCDLLGIAKDLVDQARARVEQACGIRPEHLMVACTHAHSTPDTVASGNSDPEYLERLVSGIVEAVGLAAARLKPARMGFGSTPIRGLAQSRRVRLKDGRVYTTRYGVPSTWRVPAELIDGQGSIDPALSVIRIDDLDGNIICAISNFGCHASVALCSTNVSGDYPGETMVTLERALGDDAVVLCSIAAAADVDPTLEMPFWGPRNDANATRLGRIFAGQVLECLARVTTGDEPRVAGWRAGVALPVRGDWIHMLRQEQDRLAQEFASFSTQNPVLQRLLDDGVVHTEVQALRINDLTLVGLPGEVFTSTGFKTKALFGGSQALVVQLANDYVGYILTPEAAREGGYETGLHLYSRVTAEAEALLLDAVAGIRAAAMRG